MKNEIADQMLAGFGPLSRYLAVPVAYYIFGFAFLVAITAAIAIWTRRAGWVRFSQNNKWSSRAVLFVATIFIVVPLALVPSIVLVAMPGKIAMESPNLTGTAIKLGLYGLYMQHAVADKLAPDNSAAANCVWQMANVEAQKHQSACGDDPSCYEHIPAMTKDAILTKIRDTQSGQPGIWKNVTDACRDVDVTKL